MIYNQIRRRMFDILEHDTTGDRVADWVYYFLVSTIVVSVVAAVLATVPSWAWQDSILLNSLEHFSILVFSVEYVARVWCAPEHPLRRHMPAWRARLHYVMTPAAIIDLVAIMPIILADFMDVSLQTLLVLRLLRFFKLARYSSGFNALYTAIRHERYALLACFLILGASVLLTATAAYLAERTAQPDNMGSIPLAMWWSITTLTTVGYGDIVPHTEAGRLIAAATMVIGVLMVALPIAIISSSFSTLISKHDFVVTYSMLSRLPLFNDLDSSTLTDLLPVLDSRSFDRGRAVVVPGETSHRIFVVLEGLLDAETVHGPVCLGPGDVFGTVPSLEAAIPPPDAVRAMTKVRLLAIDADAAKVFTLRHPEMRERFTEAAMRQAGASGMAGLGGSRAKPAASPKAAKPEQPPSDQKTS
ncbi:cyclic nucleotide-gated ion channel [Xanthobacter sp. TB0136]|uniref:cyclic nucleotide-gated ion channel n=1 Tax=Xanthobacter sp. TB0136 TaxID=3459177 RepID=UPI0040396192